jgi:hypothetical protein
VSADVFKAGASPTARMIEESGARALAIDADRFWQHPVSDQVSGVLFAVLTHRAHLLYRIVVAAAVESGKKLAESGYLLVAGAGENGMSSLSVSLRSFA